MLRAILDNETFVGASRHFRSATLFPALRAISARQYFFRRVCEKYDVLEYTTPGIMITTTEYQAHDPECNRETETTREGS